MGCGGKDAWNKKGLEYCATLLVGIAVHDGGDDNHDEGCGNLRLQQLLCEIHIQNMLAL
jgi:hypothetical protein